MISSLARYCGETLLVSSPYFEASFRGVFPPTSGITNIAGEQNPAGQPGTTILLSESSQTEPPSSQLATNMLRMVVGHSKIVRFWTPRLMDPRLPGSDACAKTATPTAFYQVADHLHRCAYAVSSRWMPRCARPDKYRT